MSESGRNAGSIRQKATFSQACRINPVPGQCQDAPYLLSRIMNRQQLLDAYFLDARAKLIDIAAFLDRLDHAEGNADFRADAFAKALARLQGTGDDRARQVLLTLSDPTTEPIPAATTKAACGAWPGKS